MGYSWTDMFNLLQNLSPVLSNAAGGAAAGKVAEQNAAAIQNQNATSRYQAMVNANRLQNIEQPSANMNQAARGALVSTWQPMSVTPASVPYGSQTNGAVMPKISGGPTITPEMRQTGDAVMRSALSRQLSGNPVNTSMFPSDAELGLNPLPTESLLDKILKWGSFGSGILGAVGKTGLLGGGAKGAAVTPGVGGGIPGVNYTPGSPASIPSPTTATTTTAGTGGSAFPGLGAGGGSTVGGNAGWMADEFKKMLMHQGLWAGGGSPWDQPVDDWNGWALPGQPTPPRN